LDGLVFFPGGKKEDGGRFCKGFEEGVAPKCPDFRGGEDEDATGQFANCTFNAGSEGGDQSAAREYVVFSRRSFYPYGLHVDSILSKSGASACCGRGGNAN